MTKTKAPHRAGCSGRAWQAITTQVKALHPPICRRCGGDIDTTLHHNHPQAWTAGHIVDVALGGHPTALWNLRPEHRSCNSSAGATLHNQLRHRPRTPLTW